MKLLAAFCLLITYCAMAQQRQRIMIKKRVDLQLYHPAMFLSNDEHYLNVGGKKYLIMSEEFFDTAGTLDSATQIHDLAYLEMSKKELYQYRDAIESAGFDRQIDVKMAGEKNIIINGKRYAVKFVDIKRRQIAYYPDNNHRHLNLLSW